MFDGQFVFSQVLDFLPRRDFTACVERYGGNSTCRGKSQASIGLRDGAARVQIPVKTANFWRLTQHPHRCILPTLVVPF